MDQGPDESSFEASQQGTGLDVHRVAQLLVFVEVLFQQGLEQHAEIVGDESILPGGCRVFTSHGHVDADLKTQLDRVTVKLLPGGAGGGGGA